MLLGTGIALLAYYVVKIFIKKGVTSRICYGLIIASGILHMNKMYLFYQQDWYSQLRFMNEIAESQYIRDHDTFLCIFDRLPATGGTRFYSLNGASREVTGQQTKLFMCGISELTVGVAYNKWLHHGYNMDDYTQADTTIDGVIFIRDKDMGLRETVSMKWDELFNRDRFWDRNLGWKDIVCVPIDKENSEMIYKLYKEGRLGMGDIEEMCLR